MWQEAVSITVQQLYEEFDISVFSCIMQEDYLTILWLR